MKEFKVEMLVKGKWVTPRIPFGGGNPGKICDNVAEANTRYLACINAWEKYKRNFPQYANNSCNPTDFRIVSREVTEWEATKRED